jgi:importin-7
VAERALCLPHRRFFGRMVSYALTVVNISIKPKVTWNLLKNNVPDLLAHVIFPLLCLTQEDLELWEEDPVEYIHKKIGMQPLGCH